MNKILIIGDSCNDVFVYCDASRLCPDIPVPVLNINYQVETPGMASNVYRNIKEIIDCDIITNENWRKISKTRYIHEDSNHMFIRVDSNDKIERINLDKIDYNYDIIIISDYNKGFLEKEDIVEICNKHDNVFLDTKKVLGNWAKNAKFIKINNFEFKNSEKFLNEELLNKIIHTKGSEGCFFKGKNYPVDKVEVKDTSGAGDSFMSALVIKYLSSSNIEESIKYANKCASKVVKERGITTINKI